MKGVLREAVGQAFTFKGLKSVAVAIVCLGFSLKKQWNGVATAVTSGYIISWKRVLSSTVIKKSMLSHTHTSSEIHTPNDAHVCSVLQNSWSHRIHSSNENSRHLKDTYRKDILVDCKVSSLANSFWVFLMSFNYIIRNLTDIILIYSCQNIQVISYIQISTYQCCVVILIFGVFSLHSRNG